MHIFSLRASNMEFERISGDASGPVLLHRAERIPPADARQQPGFCKHRQSGLLRSVSAIQTTLALFAISHASRQSDHVVPLALEQASSSDLGVRLWADRPSWVSRHMTRWSLRYIELELDADMTAIRSFTYTSARPVPSSVTARGSCEFSPLFLLPARRLTFGL
jgi:hypothetical protein